MVLADHLAPGYTVAQFQAEAAKAQRSRQSMGKAIID